MRQWRDRTYPFVFAGFCATVLGGMLNYLVPDSLQSATVDGYSKQIFHMAPVAGLTPSARAIPLFIF